ncbi:hypothetical protein PV410_36815 [Streptomyces sp. PA03-5A]|nr:hypothetical protein [Streptomyces sp. PA03-5A]
METTKTHGAAADGRAADAELDRAEDDGATSAPAPAPDAGPPAPADLDTPDDLDEADDLDEPDTLDTPDAPRPAGVVPGAAAVVGAALGLASLTGTWLGTVLAERRQLVGQINTSSGSAAQQIEQIYGGPWHTTAAVNGVCALIALVVLGAVLLAGRNAAPWVRAVAWGGLALGALGLCVALGTWFDLFGGLPSVAEAPVSSGG